MNTQQIKMNIAIARLSLERARKEISIGTGTRILDGLQEALDAVLQAKEKCNEALSKANSISIKSSHRLAPTRIGVRY